MKKWKVGDWYRCLDLKEGAPYGAAYQINSADCAAEFNNRLNMAVVRVSAPKPILTRKIKRSELRAWFERQVNPYVAYSRPHSKGPYGVACDWSSREGSIFYGPTLEQAILKLRQAMRKAGTFKP